MNDGGEESPSIPSLLERFMNFDLNENQKMFRDMVRDFAAKEIVPIAHQMDVAERVITVLETLPGRALSPTRQPRVDGMVDTDHVGLEE